MPDFCSTLRCVDCESHAIVQGKLDCNYMNRLGLSQPGVTSFIEMPETPEQLAARIKNAQDATAALQDETAKLLKMKEIADAAEREQGA